MEAYEEKHYPISPPDPIEAILHYMESQGLSESDLGTYLGSRTCVSEILNRERALSLAMIRKLHKGLGIPADILVQPYAARIDEVADWNKDLFNIAQISQPAL